MKLHNEISRLATPLLAAVVATLTFTVVAHATQVITTPNAAFVAYSLPPNGNSAPITPVPEQAAAPPWRPLPSCLLNPLTWLRA